MKRAGCDEREHEGELHLDCDEKVSGIGYQFLDGKKEKKKRERGKKKRTRDL